tara:strand:- start:521 stop:808 length:288 start_codon:yes stop_codon:yes gene_type:complete
MNRSTLIFLFSISVFVGSSGVCWSDGPGLPLLLPHGGPGAGHDYLESLAAIGDERPIIFYDQLGCGKSDIPGNPFLWTIERLAILRSEGLKNFQI